MSTTETKVRYTWAAQHTAGHDMHGQTAIYDERPAGMLPLCTMATHTPS
jgi:hypothetical protein